VKRAALVILVVVAACKGRTSSPPRPAAAPDARSLYGQGKAALEDKRLNDAVKLFTQATALAGDPEFKANAWLGLGAAYGELGDTAHAVAAWEQVTVLRPDDADAWRVLAEGLAQAGQRERQALALAHIVAVEPDDLAAYLELAGLDTALGHGDAAKDVYLRYESRRRDAVLQLGKARDAETRAAAAEALGGARDAGTARALLLAMTDKEAAVRMACARALGRIGADVDAEVRPALKLLLQKESDEKVRTAIEDALK
jgi:tetratricopeptide (TPR) repeat protein